MTNPPTNRAARARLCVLSSERCLSEIICGMCSG
jgi:hypothetical protein